MTTTAYFMATSTDDTLIVMCDSYASLPERRLTPHYRKMNNQRLASKTCFASSCRDPALSAHSGRNRVDAHCIGAGGAYLNGGGCGAEPPAC
jgi:hypothetical protein